MKRVLALKVLKLGVRNWLLPVWPLRLCSAYPMSTEAPIILRFFSTSSLQHVHRLPHLASAINCQPVFIFFTIVWSFPLWTQCSHLIIRLWLLTRYIAFYKTSLLIFYNLIRCVVDCGAPASVHQRTEAVWLQTGADQVQYQLWVLGRCVVVLWQHCRCQTG